MGYRYAYIRQYVFVLYATLRHLNTLRSYGLLRYVASIAQYAFSESVEVYLPCYAYKGRTVLILSSDDQH